MSKRKAASTPRVPTPRAAASSTTCWASSAKTGLLCGKRVVPRPGEGGDPVPYCADHLRRGDPCLREIKGTPYGSILVARRALPKGYRMVYWGSRSRCPMLIDGEDRCLLFDKKGCGNNGVINPTDHAGSVLQFASCPGPGERANMKGTGRYFGQRNGTMAGRAYVALEPIPVGTQLAHNYGEGWWEARGIARQDVGTVQYPMPRRKTSRALAARGGGMQREESEASATIAPMLSMYGLVPGNEEEQEESSDEEGGRGSNGGSGRSNGHQTTTLLEVGCGPSGGLALPLSKLAGAPFGRVVAVDSKEGHVLASRFCIEAAAAAAASEDASGGGARGGGGGPPGKRPRKRGRSAPALPPSSVEVEYIQCGRWDGLDAVARPPAPPSTTKKKKKKSKNKQKKRSSGESSGLVIVGRAALAKAVQGRSGVRVCQQLADALRARTAVEEEEEEEEEDEEEAGERAGRRGGGSMFVVLSTNEPSSTSSSSSASSPSSWSGEEGGSGHGDPFLTALLDRLVPALDVSQPWAVDVHMSGGFSIYAVVDGRISYDDHTQEMAEAWAAKKRGAEEEGGEEGAGDGEEGGGGCDDDVFLEVNIVDHDAHEEEEEGEEGEEEEGEDDEE